VRLNSAAKRGAIIGGVIAGLLSAAVLYAMIMELERHLGKFDAFELVPGVAEVIGIAGVGAVAGGAIGHAISKLR